MARQPKPKALSPLQSDQRSYTSELSWYPEFGLRSLQSSVGCQAVAVEWIVKREFGVWSPEELVLARYSAELIAEEHRLRSRCQPYVVL
jgi:hypothetical protein